MQALGARFKLTMRWEGAHLRQEQVTFVHGEETSRATITHKYDRARDLIISENDSVEGSYVRTFKRVVKV